MEKKQEFKVNIGGSSIILIIVVFALSIFAVLSIKASNSDLVLAKKTKASVASYYKADSEAEECLAQIDQVLRTFTAAPNTETMRAQLADLPLSPQLEEKTKTDGTITYAVQMNDYAALQVELTYQLSDTTASQYTVTTWKIEQQAIGDYDFSDFEFWDGTIEEE